MKKILALATVLSTPVTALVKPVKDSVGDKFLKGLAKALNDKGVEAVFDAKYGLINMPKGKMDSPYMIKALKSVGWLKVRDTQEHEALFVKNKVFWPLEVNTFSGHIYVAGESYFDNKLLVSTLKKLVATVGFKYAGAYRDDETNYLSDSVEFFASSKSPASAADVEGLARAVGAEFGVNLVKAKGKDIVFKGALDGISYQVSAKEGDTKVSLKFGDPAYF